MQPIWDAEKAAVAAKANRETMVGGVILATTILAILATTIITITILAIFATTILAILTTTIFILVLRNSTLCSPTTMGESNFSCC